LAWAHSHTWTRHLSKLARRAARDLQAVWQLQAPRTAASAAGEEFVAIAIGLCIREILARLTNAVLFSVITLFLLLGSHTLFPLAPRQTLLATSWAFLLTLMVVALSVFVEIDRNEAISAITGTPAGKLNWDSTTVTRALVYGVIPLATLVAAQFPQFGDLISSWVLPVQRALP
jgi:hypothetical protein